MGILAKSLGINALSLEDPTQPLLPPSALFESLGLGRSDAGVLVNERQAFRLSPVFACFKIISEDLSKIPLSVYQQLPDFSVRLAPEHRVHKLIHDEPNDVMTAAVFRASLITSALAFGNAFAFIERDRAARVVSLHLMPSDRTSAVFINGKFGFATTATQNGQAKWIEADNVIHLIGLSMDGVTGYSPVTTCKNAIGIGLAAEKFAAQFFGNGARATGVLTHPEHLDAEAYENLKKSVREWATGENALRPIILEEGLKWDQITINPNDGQVVETRKFQVEEVARLYRVPLHKLGELSRSTNNNIEHQGIEHNQDALQPWAVKLEQEINRKLLGGSYFCEHDFSELERGDSASVATGLLNLRNGGFISTNDGLRKLRMNPISEDEGGNIRIIQGANVPLSSLVNWNGATSAFDQKSGKKADDEQEADAERGDLIPDKNAEFRKQIFASYRRLFRDVIGRAINRQQPIADYVRKAIHPVLASMLEAINVVKYGSTSVSESDEQRISSVADQIAGSSGEWTQQNASDMAAQIMRDSYAALSA
jgi:HK97 family phage portal protein